MSHVFGADVMQKAKRRQRKWCQENLLTVLEQAKDRQARDIEVSIELAKELLAIYAEKLPKPVEVPAHTPEPFVDDSMMRHMDPAVRAILHDSTEKGAAERYLRERNKKSPDEKLVILVQGGDELDYGWQQKASRVRARDFNFGRCAYYEIPSTEEQSPPDPPHVSQASVGILRLHSVLLLLWLRYFCLELQLAEYGKCQQQPLPVARHQPEEIPYAGPVARRKLASEFLPALSTALL
ncbi:hypothetical protein MSG28_008493 [Choristoneura fumiferana]|uniref:Uncharacterized protein n=1 Tax=Choristoneura fumiferana TaxID=7141 RepID=A0ACC0J5H1_CHOFU|nr:hypothetical protein MSG28_008493 [Choristoneura fumiferana]